MRRRLAGVAAAIVVAAAAPVASAGAAGDVLRDCIARNGARYTTPDSPRVAQYVGVSGLCKSGEGIVVSVTADPASGGSGGGNRDGGVGAPASGGSGGGGGAGGGAPSPAPAAGAPGARPDTASVALVRDALRGGGSGGSVLTAGGGGVPTSAWLALAAVGGLAGAGAVYRIAGRR